MLIQKLMGVTGVGAEWILYLLILLSVVSIAIIVERFFALSAILKESKKVADRAKDALKANDLKVLEDLSKNSDALESRVLAHALRHLDSRGPKGIEELMSGFVLMEKPTLEKNLGFLATLGSNAPFIGLLGTVLGIIKAFADLSISQGNPSVVMAGISEALIATAVGLFVAIPAVVSYNYFQKQVKQILQNVESIKQLCLTYAAVKGGK